MAKVTRERSLCLIVGREYYGAIYFGRICCNRFLVVKIALLQLVTFCRKMYASGVCRSVSPSSHVGVKGQLGDGKQQLLYYTW